MNTTASLRPFLASLCLLVSLTAQDDGKPRSLTVHEWGTFTVLQDERGVALPGVNINEESLPRFVHRLSSELAPDSHELGPVLSLGTHRRFASKGIARSYPAARMRMETPIIYFYPRTSSPFEIDVRVEFYRGWVSEWYPDALSVAPGFADKKRAMIPRDRFGSVTWKGLTVGSQERPPKTNSKVWLAPRIRKPATVVTKKGQAERYLFYRGVADLVAPLRVTRDVDGETLCVQANVRATKSKAAFRFSATWLADVRADGQIAFRPVPPFTTGLDAKIVHAKISGRFRDSDYKPEGVSKLRKSMAAALRSAGLFSAEAKAMLATWAISYFKSPGLRLFFLLPREWIDTVLPLHLSRKADIERVMIGRIELITPEQRRIVRKIAASESVSSPEWFHRELKKIPAAKRNETIAALMNGQMDLDDLELDVPTDYRIYLTLGRFRDAIVLQEESRRSTPALKSFVANYRLRYFHENRRP